MKTQKSTALVLMMVVLAVIGCRQQENTNAAAAPQRPSDADLIAFKVYHHMMYRVTTAKQAGGTNKLFHTRELPTEGTDPVVTPALDYIYTKAVIDLSERPAVVEIGKQQYTGFG